MDARHQSSDAVSVGMVLFPDLTQLDLTGPYQETNFESPRQRCQQS